MGSRPPLMLKMCLERARAHYQGTHQGCGECRSGGVVGVSWGVGRQFQLDNCQGDPAGGVFCPHIILSWQLKNYNAGQLNQLTIVSDKEFIIRKWEQRSYDIHTSLHHRNNHGNHHHHHHHDHWKVHKKEVCQVRQVTLELPPLFGDNSLLSWTCISFCCQELFIYNMMCTLQTRSRQVTVQFWGMLGQ